MTHICVSKLAIIGTDNGLPGRHEAIIGTNAGILLIKPLGTNFSENVIEIYTFSFKKMHLKISSGRWRPFCLGLNVLIKVKLYLWSFIQLSYHKNTLYAPYVNGLVQDCSNSIANALELLQFCSSKFCSSRLLVFYSSMLLSFLLTFFWLFCYCSMWLFFSPGN